MSQMISFENLVHVLILTNFGLVILIWLIQILHYPSFFWIDKNDFSLFAKFHSEKITSIVLPLMLIEFFGSFYLLFFDQGELLVKILILILLVLIWLSTFLIQVPLHHKLLVGKDNEVIKKLINTNWIRTILWSLKFVVLLYTRKLFN